MVKPSAKRCLFGVDHELTRDFLQTRMNQIVKESTEKWNFDFVRERPLEGRFKWKRVIAHPKHIVHLPAPECSDTHSDTDIETRREGEEPSSHLDVPPQPSDKPAEDLSIIRPVPLKRKRDQSQQTTVPEFFQCIKRQKTKN